MLKIWIAIFNPVEQYFSTRSDKILDFKHGLNPKLNSTQVEKLGDVTLHENKKNSVENDKSDSDDVFETKSRAISTSSRKGSFASRKPIKNLFSVIF